MNRLSEADREDLGRRVMLAMICTHDGDEFGDKAVCVTCWENTQRVGRVVEAIVAARLASVEEARYATTDWGRSYNAPRTGIGGPASQRLPDPRDEALASVKALADEWEHVGKTDRAAKRAHDKLRAALGSDAHTEPCDPDCEAGPTHDPDLHLPRHKHAHTEQKGTGE